CTQRAVIGLGAQEEPMARRIVFPGPRRVALESTDPPPIERGMGAGQAPYTLMSNGTDNILKRRHQPQDSRHCGQCPGAFAGLICTFGVSLPSRMPDM